MAGKYTNPTWNRDFPITLENCGECAATCPFVTGTQVLDILVDLKCSKPLPDIVNVEVEGVPEGYIIEKEEVNKVFCGQCGTEGIRREIGG